MCIAAIADDRAYCAKSRAILQRTRQRQKGIEKLSRREKEVLDRLAQGIPVQRNCGRPLGEHHTVRMHIKGIYGKLHVHSRGEAVAKYLTK